MSFCKDFLWGAASAAAQVEGAYNEDGKGLTIWDDLGKGHIRFDESNKVACDHYHRYIEDVQIMKKLGLKSYRFSIAWSRVFPKNNDDINEKGLEFYSKLVDELIDNGIEPLCTLYH